MSIAQKQLKQYSKITFNHLLIGKLKSINKRVINLKSNFCFDFA